MSALPAERRLIILTSPATGDFPLVPPMPFDSLQTKLSVSLMQTEPPFYKATANTRLSNLAPRYEAIFMHLLPR